MRKLIKFYADWCAPCKAYAPAFEEVSKELENYEVINVNIDNDTEGLAAKYKVKSIPFTILESEKGAKRTFQGVLTADELRKFINL